MNRIIVLGAGVVGRSIVADLSKRHNVTAADIDEKSLAYLAKNFKIKTHRINLMEEEQISSKVKDYDLAISAVPGFMGYDVVRTVIEAGKNIVDISFMPEEFTSLNVLAAKKGVTAITDCGVAPGLTNLIAGFHNEMMEIDSIEYFAGGLPQERTYPFYYKAPFSPVDVIEMYIRPARYIENGRLMTKPAMSDPEFINFDKVGTLEAFCTDGLRSLLTNLSHVPNMREKTLRYPGHLNHLLALKTAGFFNKTPITINNTAIRPIDFTSKILINDWKLGQEEKDLTVMRIVIKGIANGQRLRVKYELYDEYDDTEKLSSMGRSTGFAAAAHAELILNGKFSGKGVYPPELVGMDAECFDFVMDFLRQRGVIFKKSEENV